MIPTVSVAMGVYNVEKYIRQAVNSILSQDYGDLEVVVVDDGSSDSTVALLEEIQDSRLRVVRRSHRGSAPARNEAIRLSSGKYVALVDGDDVYLPGKLKRHVDELEKHPEIDVSFALFKIIDENGDDMGSESTSPNGTLSFESVLVHNPINGSAAVVRRSALAASGLFDENMPSCLDVDLWLRLALVRDSNIQCIPEVLSCYRRRRGQITGDWHRMERGWSMMMQKLRALAPERVQRAYPEAYSKWQLYMAYLADAQRDPTALTCWRRSVAAAPMTAAANRYTWMLGAALLSRVVLPERFHTALRHQFRRVLR